jgi:hypothetical protein
VDKIFNSIILTGFLIVSSLLVTFFINTNEIFAIEYKTYPNQTVKDIEFQYPSDWELDTEVDVDDPNLEKGVSIEKYDNEEMEEVSDLQSFTEEVLQEELELNQSEGIDYKLLKIEDPKIISIGNLEMGTFIEEYINEEDSETTISQYWTTIVGGQGYAIEFYAPTSTFNSTEVSEMRDHFIKSFKIIGANQS